MESEKYFWVIGGGAMQVPVIKEARALGLMIICSDQNPDCVCKPLADIIDIFDIEAAKCYGVPNSDILVI